MWHILTDVAGKHVLLENSCYWLPLEEATEDARGVLLYATEEEAQLAAGAFLARGIHVDQCGGLRHGRLHHRFHHQPGAALHLRIPRCHLHR